MSNQSEDIILQLNDIKYKKNNGQLYLSSKRVAWMMNEQDTFSVNIQFSDIRNLKISPDSKPKVQLQLVLQDQSTYTFQFCNPDAREKQVSERDQVKERLGQLMVQNKRRPPDELMEKKQLLEENSHLRQLYMALVPTQIISTEEFWKEIAGQYRQGLGPKLDVGVSGAFLADIKPQTDSSNGKVQYNLTPEIMLAVFKTYPTVKKKHEEYVPHRMSESEFWTRFFQSHYYSAHTTSRSENVFSECARHDDKEWNRELSSVRNDPLYNLSDIYEESTVSIDTELKAVRGKAGSNHIHATMIRRFNQHSLNILKAQTSCEKEKLYEEVLAQNPEAINNGISLPEINLSKSKKAKLADKIQYDDLECTKSNEAISITIHQKDRYLSSHGIATDVPSISKVEALQNKLSFALYHWQPDLLNSQSADSAFITLSKYSEICWKGRNSRGIKTGEHLPLDLHKELSNVYASASELLRHFWACFPARTPQLQEKLHKMHDTICRYHEATVRPFQELSIREYNCSSSIMDHLLEMFHIANAKYEIWKSRNPR